MSAASIVWLGRGLVLALAVGCGYWIAAQHYGKQLAQAQRDQVMVSNASLNATRATEQQQQATIATVDADNWQELIDAQHQIQTLRAALAAGERRVYVAADCSSSLPSTAGSPSLGAATAGELTGQARQDYLDFRAGYAFQRQQLMACQAIVNAWQQQR